MTGSPAGDSTRPATRWITGLVVIVAVGVLIVLARSAASELPRFAERVRSFGLWAPLVFIAAYAIATVAFVPGSLLTLAGGAMFGLVRGTIFVFTGAVIGASAAFLLARYAARDVIARRITKSARFAAVDRAVGESGRKIVLLLRLSPLFPFNFLNYALGLTRVRFSDYLVGSIGMIPGTVLYVAYGVLIGDVAAIASGARPPRGTSYYALFAVGLVAAITVTTIVARLARRAIATVSDTHAESSR